MNRSRLMRLAGVAASAGAVLLLGNAAPVLAQTVTATPRPLAQATLATCKQIGHDMVTARLGVLSSLAAKVAASTTLSSAHSAALGTLLSSDRSGLSALDATIQADTTLAQCRGDVQSIVTRYRVYVLVVPQVHIVIAADALQAAGNRLATLEPRLAAAIQDAHLNPGQQQRAGDALNDYTSNVSRAGGLIAGQADAVLALTPAGYPGTQTTLKAAHGNLKAAREDLENARHDFDTIADILGLPAH